MFRRLFIANRGEVAARIARSCDRLGITPVFAVSTADLEAPYLRHREYVCLGPARPDQSYLDMHRVVQAAKQSRCSALHPGWGFLSENPVFASLCLAHGVEFIGPPAQVMAKMASKVEAKRVLQSLGVMGLAGSEGLVRDLDEARSCAEHLGYPVLLKADRGGGGKGMRVVNAPEELDEALSQARAETRAAFADEGVYLEKLITGGRHIEIQLLADRYGNAVHLGERDCSLQRKHQKLLEESPSPVLDTEERARVCEAARLAAERMAYVGAGTMEFLLDDEGRLRFMEMNPRLQVEHGVSEMRSGIDLVEAQIRIAAREPLPFAQGDIELRDHVIECRINAEDPAQDFSPSPGRLEGWKLPSEAPAGSVRVDTFVEEGYEIQPFYDSLIAKVLSRGTTREEAIETMQHALSTLEIRGVATTRPFFQALLASADFREHRYHTAALPALDLGAFR